MEGRWVGQHVLEGSHLNLVTHGFPVCRVPRRAVNDLEDSGGVRVQIEPSRVLNKCFGHLIAHVVGIRIIREAWHEPHCTPENCLIPLSLDRFAVKTSVDDEQPMFLDGTLYRTRPPAGSIPDQ